MTVKGIAGFDVGDVGGSGTFSARLSLSATGKVLTATITSGSIKVNRESFNSANQIGGSVEDLSGNRMASAASIGDPSGTFGVNSSNNNRSPYITAIKISNEGSKGVIDNGDTIKLTFSKSIDPKSINAGLTAGGSVTGIASSQIGGVNVSSSGSVNISGIVAFDAGTVTNSGNFISKLALDSSGMTLTITLGAEAILPLPAKALPEQAKLAAQSKTPTVTVWPAPRMPWYQPEHSEVTILIANRPTFPRSRFMTAAMKIT